MSFWITAWTVFGVTALDSEVTDTALGRGAATVIGVLLALAAYLAWPTRTAPQLPERLAGWLDTQSHFLTGLLNASADPGANRNALEHSRAAARQAWYDLCIALDYTAQEPGPSSPIPDDLLHQTLPLSRAAHLREERLATPQPPEPAAAEFAARFQTRADTISAAIRQQQPHLPARQSARRLLPISRSRPRPNLQPAPWRKSPDH